MGARWTADELDALARLYPLHGPGWGGWEEALPGRGRRAILRKAGQMGVQRFRRWTPREEREVLEALVALARSLRRPPDTVVAHMGTMMDRQRQAARAERLEGMWMR